MIEYQLDGKIRSAPLASEFTTKLETIVGGIDPDLGIRVRSAGQPQKGSPLPRTGSTRHDVSDDGLGHTADFVLVKDGKEIRPADNPQLYSQLFERAAPHFPGMGHYDWGVHIGGGDENFWGPGGKSLPKGSSPLNDYFAGAVSRGRMMGGTVGLDKMRNGEVTYESTHDQQKREAKAAEDAPGLGEGLGMAVQEQWVGAYLLDAMDRSGQHGYDPDFNMTGELFEEIAKDLPERYHSLFETAHSEPHARSLRERALELQEIDEGLNAAGYTGMGLRMVGALTDPIGWAVGGGAGRVAAVGRGLSAGSRIARGALAGSTANVAIDGFIATQNPNVGVDDVVLSAIAGGGLGALAGSLSRGDASPAPRDVEGRVATDSAPAPDTGLRWDDNAGDSIGAARVPGTEDAVKVTPAQQRLADAEGAAESDFGEVRIDMVGVLKQSKSPLVRKLGGLMGEDGVGSKGGRAVDTSASEMTNRTMKTTMVQFYREAESAFKAWGQARGINRVQRAFRRGEFFVEVGRAVRREAGTYTDDINVNRAADRVRGLSNDLRKLAQREGVKGFDAVAENSNYLMRSFNHRSIDGLVTRYGENNVIRLISNAIEVADDEIEDGLRLQIAQGYLRTVRQSRFSDLDMSRIFDADQVDELERMLQESTDLGADEINRITRRISAEGDTAVTPRAKQRLRVDETYRMRMGDGEEIGFEDLLDSNVERVFTSYSRQIAGQSMLAKVMREFTITRAVGDQLDDTPPSFDAVIQNIRETAGELGMTPRQMEDEIGKLELLKKAVLGQPLNKPGDSAAVTASLRMVRDYNFIRVMNQVGFAQLAEIGNIIGTGGMRTTLQHVPALRNIFKRAEDGSMSDDLLDEIEVIWGLGTDRLRNSFTNRMDDYGVFEAETIGAVENALNHAKGVTADISMMAPINMGLQRMAGRVSIQKFMNMATGGRGIGDKRLATLGLTRAQADVIMGQMRAHVGTDTGMLGRSVKRINLEQWADQDAASQFVNAIDKMTRRMIQENDIGMMSKWMTSDMGKTLIQFRTFMVGAWVKQTLYSAHVRDFDAFQAFTMSTMFAGMSYAGQTYINSFGRPDAKAYRRERLSPGAIAKSAFQRAGAASIIPAAIDQAAQFADYEPVFSYGRTTGLATQGWLSNPSLDLVDTLVSSIKERDANKAVKTLAFQNAMGIRNIQNLLRD